MSTFSATRECKIEGCECYKQEIPTQMLYWLSHRGMDIIRPLFYKPYHIQRKSGKRIETNNSRGQKKVPNHNSSKTIQSIREVNHNSHAQSNLPNFQPTATVHFNQVT